MPWHNNNAEHAIKHFAKYRMLTNGRVTAKSLQPYLVLLSIYQTCVYKKVNFLRFLLSGEQDVEAPAEIRKRRRANVPCRNLTGRPEPDQVASVGPATVEPGPGEPASRGPGEAEPADRGLGVNVPTDLGVVRKAMATIEEITRRVAAGEDDFRLKWSRGGRRVRILIRRAFPDKTVLGPLLHRTLEVRLKAVGWTWAFNAVVHTYERCGTVEECRRDQGGVGGDPAGGSAAHRAGFV